MVLWELFKAVFIIMLLLVAIAFAIIGVVAILATIFSQDPKKLEKR